MSKAITLQQLMESAQMAEELAMQVAQAAQDGLNSKAQIGHTHHISGVLSIPVVGWKNDGTAGYPYYCDVVVPNVTASDRADVSIAPVGLMAVANCGICPTTETMDGKVRFRAKSVPAAAISASYWVTKGV